MMNKNTCPSCNVKVNSIWMSKVADPLLVSQAANLGNLHEVHDNEPETPQLFGEPAEDLRSRIYLFNRDESSIY